MTTSVGESPVHGAPAPAAPQRRPPRGVWLVVGLALVLIGAGTLLVSTAFDEDPGMRVVGPNLPVNDGARDELDLRANNSPALVRSPVDEANVVVANRVDSPEYSCALNVSFDGGGRWTAVPIPAPAGATAATRCFAPDAVFGPDGTLYLSYVTLKGRANAPDAVWITRSRDGGKTFLPPRRTPLPRHAFQVRLTPDAVVPGRLYMTWLQAGELGLYQFAETGNPIQAIRSDDGGATWSDPVRVSAPSRQRVVAPSPAAGTTDGELFVLYLDLGEDSLDYAGAHQGQGGPPYDGTWELVLSRSTDGGRTWQESLVDDAVVPTERFIVFTPPSPSLAVSAEGDVFAAFHDGRHGDADVLLWRLGSGEAGWSGPVRVNDTPRGDGRTQSMPAVAVAPGGRVDVLYYDRRGDRADVLNEVSLQSSFDDGETFAPRLRVSDKAFSSRIGFGLERGMADMGSRLGLISTDDRAFAAWTDTRGGSVRTAKQDIARGVVAFGTPERLSEGAKVLLRGSAGALIVLGLLIAVLLGLRRRRD